MNYDNTEWMITRDIMEEICKYISKDKSNFYIRDVLGISPSIIYGIRTAMFYKDTMNEYDYKDINNKDIKKHHVKRKYSDDLIHIAASLMTYDFIRSYEISDITGITYPYIVAIRSGRLSRDITENYNIVPSKAYHNRRQRTDDEKTRAIELLKDAKYRILRLRIENGE